MPDNHPGQFRELRAMEFLAQGNAPTFPRAALGNWANNSPNNWFTTGQVAFPSLVSVQVNPLLDRRLVYGYLWASPTDASGSVLFCNVVFYRNNKKVLEIPFNYSFNFYKLSAVAGYYNLSRTAATSILAAPIGGGVATRDSLGFTLFSPTGDANNPEPQNPILLQPFQLDFECDKIDVDVLGWYNINTQYFRCFVAALAL